jgi:hypothetical protein
MDLPDDFGHTDEELSSLFGLVASGVAETDEERAHREWAERDRKLRYEILAGKMSLPEPKSLTCHHAPPPPDDSHVPSPAQVQSFLRERGIKQTPAVDCVSRWMQSNKRIDRFNEFDSGLSRHDRYKFGLVGGGYCFDDSNVLHFEPTRPPGKKASWDSPDEAVRPAEPSRHRTDAQKKAFVKLWKRLYPDLRWFGVRRLGGSRYIASWLSDVRLALLTAYYDCPNSEISGLGVSELPPLSSAYDLLRLTRSKWHTHEWGKVFRRMARQWAEEGSQTASGSRRKTSVDKSTVSDSDSVLKVTHSKYVHPSESSDEPWSYEIVSIATEFIALGEIHKKARIDELPDCWQTECLKKVAHSLAACPDSTRAVQIERSGLGRTVFMEQLAVIKKRTAETEAMSKS